MSFELGISVPGLDWELAERIESATNRPECVTVHPWPRRRWLRPRKPSLWIDDDANETPVLDDRATWDEQEFTLHPVGREALAQSLLVPGDLLAPGWFFRACWTGEPTRGEKTLAPAELAGLVRRSGLNRFTRYRVASAST